MLSTVLRAAYFLLVVVVHHCLALILPRPANTHAYKFVLYAPQ